MVTRSEAGISLFDSAGNRFDFPVQAKEVKDVTGAGDTVLAMLAHALANELSYAEAAQLCNVAAGIAIEHVGCARVTLSDLALRLFEHHRGHKVFDKEHLFVLQEVLKQKPYSLLILPQLEQLTQPLFQAIKSIAHAEETLLLYLDEIEPKEAFMEMLASLREVGFIVLHLDSLKHLCQCSAPRATYLFDAGASRVMPGNWQTYLSRYQTAEVS
jgi:D-beta-D-heptose 7-phosphate kinase/D-beta-D-heptose 1-phosphate adenosyltransferase